MVRQEGFGQSFLRLIVGEDERGRDDVVADPADDTAVSVDLRWLTPRRLRTRHGLLRQGSGAAPCRFPDLIHRPRLLKDCHVSGGVDMVESRSDGHGQIL